MGVSPVYGESIAVIDCVGVHTMRLICSVCMVLKLDGLRVGAGFATPIFMTLELAELEVRVTEWDTTPLRRQCACETCGTVFTIPRQRGRLKRYCSAACQPPKYVKKVYAPAKCLSCGGPTRQGQRGPAAMYCSKACGDRYARHARKPQTFTLVCKGCSKTFTDTRRHGYCSSECYPSSHRKTERRWGQYKFNNAEYNRNRRRNDPDYQIRERGRSRNRAPEIRRWAAEKKLQNALLKAADMLANAATTEAEDIKKRANLESRRLWHREKQRLRYHSDPEYREKILARRKADHKKKYRTDAAYRERIITYQSAYQRKRKETCKPQSL